MNESEIKSIELRPLNKLQKNNTYHYLFGPLLTSSFLFLFPHSPHNVVLVFNRSSDNGTLSPITPFSPFNFLLLCLFWSTSLVLSFFPCSLLFLVLNCQQYLTNTIIIIQNTMILAMNPTTVHMLLKNPAADTASHVVWLALNCLSPLQLQL